MRERRHDLGKQTIWHREVRIAQAESFHYLVRHGAGVLHARRDSKRVDEVHRLPRKTHET
jgi:hypothetical protein